MNISVSTVLVSLITCEEITGAILRHNTASSYYTFIMKINLQNEARNNELIADIYNSFNRDISQFRGTFSKQQRLSVFPDEEQLRRILTLTLCTQDRL